MIAAISDLVSTNTPWEEHDLAGGRSVWVKREDLCCTDGPRFSKIRGLVEHLRLVPKGTAVACLDTIHSHGGWGTAYVCEAMGLQAHVYYPGNEPREGQIKARDRHGAILHPMRPGRSAILWYRMRRHFNEQVIKDGFGVLLPNGLQLEESRVATEKEVRDHTPPDLMQGTWVISVSTGTLAAGVFAGLKGHAKLICHMGYSRSQKRLRQTIMQDKTVEDPVPLSVGAILELVDEGFSYKDSVDYPAPFPCNAYYDLKAWKWLQENHEGLDGPICFWNVGE